MAEQFGNEDMYDAAQEALDALGVERDLTGALGFDEIVEGEQPFGGMVFAAVQMHEMFTAYVEGGFTEDQALRLVAYLVMAYSTSSGDDE